MRRQVSRTGMEATDDDVVGIARACVYRKPRSVGLRSREVSEGAVGRTFRVNVDRALESPFD